MKIKRYLVRLKEHFILMLYFMLLCVLSVTIDILRKAQLLTQRVWGNNVAKIAMSN
jgi:hypothetical protein